MSIFIQGIVAKEKTYTNIRDKSELYYQKTM
jgi:hypothetical protein